MIQRFCDRCKRPTDDPTQWVAVRADFMADHKHIDLCLDCWNDIHTFIEDRETVVYLP